MPVKTQLFLSLGGLGLVLGGVVVAMTTYWLPHFQSQRQVIQQNDAAIAAIKRQQENLSDLGRQLTERQTAQEKLNQNVWGFSKEDSFYNFWDEFATTTGATVELASIADATPGDVPVRRDASISIGGPFTTVIRALQALPNIQPAVVIQAVRLSPADQAANVTALITVSTLWYDDAHQ